MNQFLLAKGAKIIVETCAHVQEHEKAVVITEPNMQNIAEALMAALFNVGAEPVMIVMQPRQSDGEEPPATVAAAMKASDVFFNAVYKSITHTKATREAAENGARGIMLTQFNEEMLQHGGVFADFKEIAPQCQRVAEALAGSKTVNVSTPLGTNITFSAVGRRGNALTCITSAGKFTTVPTIEANVSPLEGTAEGVIVADASIPYIDIGLLTEPVICKVHKGFITDISGGKQATILKENWESKNDPNVYNIAELGIGLNPCCKFTGAMLEDEGVYGSAHFGIGTNITLGGVIKAATHYDLIMTKPTIVADGVTIVKAGKVIL